MILLVALCWVSCDALASHPGGSSDAPSRFILQKPKLGAGFDEPYVSFNPVVWTQDLRLLRTFAGVLPCPPEKNSCARHFKGKRGKLYIVGKLNKCRFWKKNKLPVSSILQKKIAKMTAKMTMRHCVRQMN